MDTEDGKVVAIGRPGRKKGQVDHTNNSERMKELTRLRLEKRARLKKEAEERAAAGLPEPVAEPTLTVADRKKLDKGMKGLEPRSIEVLETQLYHEDPRIQQSAAKLVLEYVRGKPTQTVKQTSEQIVAIEYRTAAFQPQKSA